MYVQIHTRLFAAAPKCVRRRNNETMNVGGENEKAHKWNACRLFRYHTHKQTQIHTLTREREREEVEEKKLNERNSHEMRLHVGDIMKRIFEFCCWLVD